MGYFVPIGTKLELKEMDVGIVCKVWNIKGSSLSKGVTDQLRDSIDYVLNDEKIKCYGDMDTIDQLNRECKYIENDIKTFSGAYVGGNNLISTKVNDAVREMMDVKKMYGKFDGRAALHMIISLPENESGLDNAEDLMKLCNDVVRELFPNHQALFAIHTNTDNLHAHIIVNSVGLDGRKIHQPKSYMKDVVHPLINKFSAVYGFTQNPKWRITDDNKSFPKIKISLRKAIDQAIEKSRSFNDFVKYLEKNNIKVRVGKHISLLPEGMSKAIRTHQLGNNYSKDTIIERISFRKDPLLLPDIKNHVAVIDKTEVKFETKKLVKYKDLSDNEKKRTVSLLRMGRNPWRENSQMSWQLNKIADDINLEERMHSIVLAYSSNGDVLTALDNILEAKKNAAYDKKLIKYAKYKYKPILDIYSEMKQIEKKSYLYEHEGVTSFRPYFDKYRKLTRQLKRSYGKEIFEVASFLKECDERLLYSSEQVKELSTEYRELYRYAKKKGILYKPKQSLLDLIDYYDGIKDSRNGTVSADAFFLSSNSSDFIIKAIKYPSMDEQGRVVESYDISVIDGAGTIIDFFSSTDKDTDFKERLVALQKKYGISDLSRFDNYSLARENCLRLTSNDEIERDVSGVLFSQVVNHVRKGYSPVIVSSDNPYYYAAASYVSDEQFEISIFDIDQKHVESVSIPGIKKKSSSGFKELARIMNVYGFTDAVKEFSNLEDALKYIGSKKEIGQIKR